MSIQSFIAEKDTFWFKELMFENVLNLKNYKMFIFCWKMQKFTQATILQTNEFNDNDI